MQRPQTLVTRSELLATEQCDRRTYLERFHPELAEESNGADDLAQAQVEAVRSIASRHFPDAFDCSAGCETPEDAISRTGEGLLNPQVEVLRGPTVEHQQIRVRPSYLRRVGKRTFDLIDVKAGTKIEEHQMVDVAMQAYVLRKAGVKLRSVKVLHPNTDYVLPEGGAEPETEAYFREVDITAEAKSLEARVLENVRRTRETLGLPQAPEIRTGSRCKKPDTCPYYESCNHSLAEYPVGELPFLSEKGRTTFYEAGIRDIREIPEWMTTGKDPVITPMQQRVRRVLLGEHEPGGSQQPPQTGAPHLWIPSKRGEPRPYFNQEGFRKAYRKMTYPLHHFDAETTNNAKPMFEGARPYQTYPVQFSVHTVFEDGRIEHREYLHRNFSNPDLPYLRAKWGAVQESGTWLHHSPYEITLLKTILKRSGEHPEVREMVENLLARSADTLPLEKANLYHPAQRGSFSQKTTASLLAPDLGYEGLAIQNGSVAVVEYSQMMELKKLAGSASLDQIIRSKDTALRDYCFMDTYVMLRKSLVYDPELGERVKSYYGITDYRDLAALITRFPDEPPVQRPASMKR